MAISTSSQIDEPQSRSFLYALATTAVVLAALYFGRQLLVPIAVATLFSFLLSTPLIWLERHRLPRPLAVTLVMIAGFAVLGVLAFLAVNEFGSIVKDLPRYQQNVSNKLRSIQGRPGEGIQNVLRAFDQLKQDFAAVPVTGAQPSDKPVPVKVVSGNAILSSFGFAGASVLELLAEMFAVFVLTLFMLLNREQLRNRLLRLFGEARLIVVTTTLDDAASRVSRYLLSQFVVNGSFGLVLTLGLMVIGVPYAPFWGALVLVLRFIPYVGTLIAGALPCFMALAAFDGWQKPLSTFVLYLAIELIVSSVIEPWLYANRTGISSVAYLISVAFWTLLWGPIGLVLSTPLTVCLVVLGRHLPRLEFLHVLLGDEPVLSEEVRFYQRMLAEDEDESAALVEAALKTEPLPTVYDGLIVPALSLAEQDRHQGRLPESRVTAMYEMAREIIDAASDHHPCSEPSLNRLESEVVCMPARDEADELVANMLAQVLRQCGARAVVSHKVNADDGLVILSALPPFAIIHARSLAKRVRAEHPQVRIVLGVWGSGIDAAGIQSRIGSVGVDAVVTSFSEALRFFSTSGVPRPSAVGQS